jgi:Uma2 family endonuclease
VPEYWFVDVEREEAVFCSDPVDGTYRTVTRVTGAAQSATIPELGVDVAALFA